MTLADRLAEPPARPVRCGVDRILHTVSTEDREALSLALADPGYTTAAIHRALRDEGHQISYPVVQRHRTGGCCCVPR